MGEDEEESWHDDVVASVIAVVAVLLATGFGLALLSGGHP